jgi:D-alanyl-D-alanine carboxypeptidase (penicillin-binding protein 5/6)
LTAPAKQRQRSRQQRALYRRRRLGVLLVVFLAVLLAGWARLSTETLPDLTTTRVLASSAMLPGPPPQPDWPTQGQAAVAVAGLGTLESGGTPTPEPIASVAKIMTAYLILRDHPIAVGSTGFEITISAADVADLHARQAENQSTVQVAQDEVLNEYQLLEALLIPSGNNIAPILAGYDAGSVASFLQKMDATARELGMTQTTYTDPSGFDATTVSTASDQVLLARAAMAIPTFVEIVGERSATLPVAGVVTNFDTLVGTDGLLGVKTGSDSTAGGCFVFADRRTIDGQSVTLFGAVLGQEVGVRATSILVDAALDASRRLADSVIAEMTVRTFVPAGTPVLVVDNAQRRQVSIVTTSPLTRLGWGGLTIPLSVTIVPPGLHLDKGQQVATVTALGGSPLQTLATATTGMPALSLGWKLDHLL